MSPMRIRSSVSLATAALLAVFTPAMADPETAGLRVAPILTGPEFLPSLKPDGAGGAYVGFARELSTHQVARVLANGTPDPAWFPWVLSGLNVVTSIPRFGACIAPLGDGSVWVFSDAAAPGALFYRLTIGTGENTPMIMSGDAIRDQTASVAIAGTEGRTLILSRGVPSTASKVHPAILHSDGVLESPPPPEIFTGGSVSSYFGPAPVGIPDGEGGAHLVVEAVNTREVSGADLVAMRFLPDGNAAWTPPTRAIADVAQHQSDVTVVSDGAGGAFYAWSDDRNLIAGTDVYIQHLLADGSIGPGFVNDGRPVASFPGRQFQVRAASDGIGGAWLVWSDGRGGESDIYYTHLNAVGAPVSGFPVGGKPLCDAPGGQIEPVVSADGGGGIFVAWADERDGELDLYGQHIHSTGVVMPGWEEDGAALCTNAFSPSTLMLVTSAPGHAIVAWTDFRDGPSHIFALAFPPDGDVTSVPPSEVRGLALSHARAPARGAIEVDVSTAEVGEVTVSLLDVTGRRLEQVRRNGPLQASSVRFTQVPAPGLYFVTASQGGTRAIAKVAATR